MQECLLQNDTDQGKMNEVYEYTSCELKDTIQIMK